MRELALFTKIFLGIFFPLSLLAANQSVLDDLKARRSQSIQVLEKLTHGRDPCFSEDCQNQKIILLSKIWAHSNLLPQSGTPFFRSRPSGLNSAHRFVRNPFVGPLQTSGQAFPQTLHDWKYWWERRYSYEDQWKSEWMDFYSEVFALSDGLKAYLKVVDNSDSERREQIQQAWDRGAARAAEKIIESQVSMIESSDAAHRGDQAKARQLEQRGLAASEELKKIQAKFGGQFRTVLEMLFPDLSFRQIVPLLSTMEQFVQFSGNKKIFDPLLIEEVRIFSLEARKLVQTTQDFQDMEYGIIGLTNFYSPTVNPQVATELEINVQDFLDQIDARARQLVDYGSFYFLSIVGESVFGASYFGRIALPGLVELFSIHFEFEPSQKLWSVSSRSRDLHLKLLDLETEMEKRRAALFEAKEVLQQKIQTLDLQIKELEGNHGS